MGLATGPGSGSINIQAYYDIYPTNPYIRKDVLTPDFLERFAIVKRFIIEEGSLLINKYDQSEYKIHIIPNNTEDRGLIVEGPNEPKISLKQTTFNDIFHMVCEDNKLKFKKNDIEILFMDDSGINTNVEVTLDTLNANSINVNGSPIDDYIENHINDIINECKQYTDNQINDYNNNIVQPSYLHKFSTDLQIVYSDVEFRGNVNFNTTGGSTLNVIRKDMSDYPTQNDVFELGKDDLKWHAIYSTKFFGKLYYSSGADVAEKYTIKPTRDIQIGDVILISRDKEYDCEISNDISSHRVLGVISEDPAICLNQNLEEGQYIALKGRVKCKVKGPIEKGDPLTSYIDGRAISIFNKELKIDNFNSCIFAKALESTNKIYDIIEVVIL